MQREDDTSRRFDYLFAPVSVEDAPIGGGGRHGPDHPAPDAGQRRFALVGMAVSLGALTAAAALVLMPGFESDGPLTPQVAPTSVATSSDLPPTGSPVAALPSAPTAEPPIESPATVTAAPAPAATPQPGTSARPSRRQASTPTVRMPISVAPETRTPASNQNRRGNGNDGGGLLGGLGGGLLG